MFVTCVDLHYHCWFNLVYCKLCFCLQMCIIIIEKKTKKTSAIYVKMDGSVLKEKPSCKTRLTFFSNLDQSIYIISIAKNTSKKSVVLICSSKFFSLEVTLYFSIYLNLSYGEAQNIVFLSGLVLLVATWNCQISCKNRYAGLLVIHLLPPLGTQLIVNMQPAQVFFIGITLPNV